MQSWIHFRIKYANRCNSFMLDHINLAFHLLPSHSCGFSCVCVFALHLNFSRVNSDVAPSDSHSKPAVPELGVLSAVFEQDVTQSWAVVGKCVCHLSLNKEEEFNQVTSDLKGTIFMKKKKEKKHLGTAQQAAISANNMWKIKLRWEVCNVHHFNCDRQNAKKKIQEITFFEILYLFNGAEHFFFSTDKQARILALTVRLRTHQETLLISLAF